jgi:RNA polymerase sigma-70 factor, ECF subfamily
VPKRAEEDVLTVAYAAHAAEVYRVIFAIVTNRSAAEDLTQDTYLKAQQGLHRFDSGRPIRPWLLTIAIRTALDFERRESVRRMFWRRSHGTILSDSHADAIDILIDTDSALRLLEPKQRAVVVARHYVDLSYEEIGAALGLTPGNVGVILHRSHARLRAMLSRTEAQVSGRDPSVSRQGS